MTTRYYADTTGSQPIIMVQETPQSSSNISNAFSTFVAKNSTVTANQSAAPAQASNYVLPSVPNCPQQTCNSGQSQQSQQPQQQQQPAQFDITKYYPLISVILIIIAIVIIVMVLAK